MLLLLIVQGVETAGEGEDRAQNVLGDGDAVDAGDGGDGDGRGGV